MRKKFDVIDIADVNDEELCDIHFRLNITDETKEDYMSDKEIRFLIGKLRGIHYCATPISREELVKQLSDIIVPEYNKRAAEEYAYHLEVEMLGGCTPEEIEEYYRYCAEEENKNIENNNKEEIEMKNVKVITIGNAKAKAIMNAKVDDKGTFAIYQDMTNFSEAADVAACIRNNMNCNIDINALTDERLKRIEMPVPACKAIITNVGVISYVENNIGNCNMPYSENGLVSLSIGDIIKIDNELFIRCDAEQPIWTSLGVIDKLSTTDQVSANINKGPANTLKEEIKEIESTTAETREEEIDKLDAEQESCKATFAKTLDLIKRVSGGSGLLNRITSIVAAMESGNGSIDSIRKGMKQCENAVNNHIKFISSAADSQVKVRDLFVLNMINGNVLTVDGKEAKTVSVWTVLAVSLTRICRKVARRMRQWYGAVADRMNGRIVQTVLSGIVTVADYVKRGIKFAWNKIKIGAYFVATMVVAIGDAVISAIKFLFSQIRTWITDKKKKVSAETRGQVNWTDDFDEYCDNLTQA